MRIRTSACVLSLICISAAAAEGITIFPIDRAVIAVGAKFDFKVEFPETLEDEDVEIKIGGKSVTDALGVDGRLIEETFAKKEVIKEFEDPPRKKTYINASAYIARNCVVHAENPALTAEVFVRKEKVGEVTWRVFLPTATGKQAKNVILMLGDGMSQAHRTAARIMSVGIKQGKYNGTLAMDDMPHMGLIGTSGMDSVITDSANSAGAYTTGHKSGNGALAVYKDRTRNYEKKPADVVDDPACETIAYFARRLRGMSVGVVTDAEIQDATPAAMYAHVADRSDYPVITDMLKECNFDVIMGGGRKSFKDAQFNSFKERGYTVCETRTELLDAGTPKKLFGIFNPKNIDGVWDRKFLKNFNPPEQTDQPDLTEMAAAALRVLDTNPKGFVMLIEGARIDKFSHSLDWERAVMDTIMFDHTIALVQEYARKRDDTLVIVLGDHTHGVSIVGTYEDSPPYQKVIAEYDSENDQYVKKKVQKQGRDYVHVYDDAGYPNYVIKDGYPERLDVSRRLAVFFTNTPDYYETFNPKYGGEFKPTMSVTTATGKGESLNVTNDKYKGHPDAVLRTGNMPRGTAGSVHSCEDSIVTAMGPGSEAIHGFIDNTKIFEIMVNALNLREGEK